MVFSETYFRVIIGVFGLVSAMLSLWMIDRENYDYETKVGIKVAIATIVFSTMMFTPLISIDGGFIDMGFVSFPSLKLISDAVIMAFLASSLKDLIEQEM